MPFAAVDGGLLNSNLSSGSFARPAADLVTAAAGGASLPLEEPLLTDSLPLLMLLANDGDLQLPGGPLPLLLPPPLDSLGGDIRSKDS